MREAIITKEWGEVGFGSSKREGWAWEVAFFSDGNDDAIDRHYYGTEVIAQNAANLFERGLYYTGDHGGVEFEEC